MFIYAGVYFLLPLNAKRRHTSTFKSRISSYTIQYPHFELYFSKKGQPCGRVKIFRFFYLWSLKWQCALPSVVHDQSKAWNGQINYSTNHQSFVQHDSKPGRREVRSISNLGEVRLFKGAFFRKKGDPFSKNGKGHFFVHCKNLMRKHAPVP